MNIVNVKLILIFDEIKRVKNLPNELPIKMYRLKKTENIELESHVSLSLICFCKIMIKQPK